MDNTYNTIDLSKWTKVGEGGNGSVYTCPQQPDIILKVSHFKHTEGATEDLTDEFTRSKAVFDLGHFWLFCNLFGKKQRVQDIAHMTDKQMVQFWKTFSLAYNGLDNLEAFNAECKRFAALDVILLGHIQTLNWHERLFLGLLVKSLMK